MTDQTVPVDKLRALLDGEGSAADKIQAIYDDLLPPAPLPDPLFLAKAKHSAFGEGIVVSARTGRDGYVRFMSPDERYGDGTSYVWVPLSDLTFHTPDMSKNAAEIDTSTARVDPIDTRPTHPEFLETEEDYRSAPGGTIVAGDNAAPKLLLDGRWEYGYSGRSGHDDMAGTRRRVLRWGWEA